MSNSNDTRPHPLWPLPTNVSRQASTTTFSARWQLDNDSGEGVMQYPTALAANPLGIGSPMTIVYVSLLMFGLGVVLHVIGQIWLTYYGFKYSGGIGVGVLLVPVVTAWFAFFKLEKEGKEVSIMLWLGGLALALVTIAGFFGPLTDGLSGRAFAAGYLNPHYGMVVPSIPPKPATPKAPVTPATPDAGTPAVADGGAAAPATTDAATPQPGATDGGGAAAPAVAPGAPAAAPGSPAEAPPAAAPGTPAEAPPAAAPGTPAAATPATPAGGENGADSPK